MSYEILPNGLFEGMAVLAAPVAQSNSADKRYIDLYLMMSGPFIGICFLEFMLYFLMTVVATCKYLPIFTSESIAILGFQGLGYLIQAALFQNIRKSVGDKELYKPLTGSEELNIRFASIVHWSMYLLFYVIVFKI